MIVSLCPAATEIALAIGCGPHLAGRSHECDWPPAVLELPVLTKPLLDPAASSRAIHDAVIRNAATGATSLFQLDIAKITTICPDVILTQTICGVCAVSSEEVAAAVRSSARGARVVALSGTSLSGLWHDIVAVGAVTGSLSQARELVARLQARCDSIVCRAKALDRGGTIRPRVAVIEWLDPPMAAGNWVPELVHLAGGDDCLGRVGEHSHWIDWHAVGAADPDVIILAPCGFTLDRTLREAAATDVRGPLTQTRAAREGRLWVMDGHHLLNRPGPRLVDSLEVLASILYPGQFNVLAARSFARPLTWEDHGSNVP